jgi:iron complex transport system permease protein
MTGSSMATISALPHEISHPLLIAILTALVIILLGISLAVGYAPLDLAQAWSDAVNGKPTLEALVLTELRLPRALLGALVGFSLGITGAALQGLLRNPLAEPGIIGVSGAAALGAVIVFYFGLAGTFALALPLGGIAGGFLATLLLYALAGRGAGTMTLILAGVAINSFSGALTALALNLSPNPYAALEIVFWLLGSLADRSLAHVWLVLAPMLLGWAFLIATARALDALTLGDDTAQSLGIDLTRLRWQLIAGAGLSIGSAVAVSGAIGFVGFVVPHLLRPLTGHRPGRLLFASGLGGAALTLGADIVVRVFPIQPEIKLGVITALIGAPFLLSLIYRLRGDE